MRPLFPVSTSESASGEALARVGADISEPLTVTVAVTGVDEDGAEAGPHPICAHVGRLPGTRCTAWYTAIDAASAYTGGAARHPRNPSAKWTSRRARRVAADLAARGRRAWRP